MLAFCSALAVIEVGAGAVVAEAWKLHHDRPMLTVDERIELTALLQRLRVMEAVVAGGAVAATLLWSFLAVHNAARVTNSTRTAAFATAAWVLTPLLLVGIGHFDHGDNSVELAIVLMACRAVALYLPFGTLAASSWRVHGPRSPFMWWYVAVVLAFGVHKVFTGSIDLMSATPSDDLGRTAALYFVNAVVVSVVVLMASEASRAMHDATRAFAIRHDHLRHDAFIRVRRQQVTAELPELAEPV